MDRSNAGGESGGSNGRKARISNGIFPAAAASPASVARMTAAASSAASPSAAYLDRLNPEQRRAVEYGGPEFLAAGPLLIIAGAGSGKTNTLAHRVAHLFVNGIDPRRMLLLTFSRRAAAEMMRRVDRIAATVLRQKASPLAEQLAWAGTFHAIGARLLREYAQHIGLERAFTIHDREDSADLMNLVRHDLGFSRTQAALPRQGHLPRHLFARRECAGAARGRARRVLSVVRHVGGGAAGAVRRLCGGQAEAMRARLRRSPALLVAHDGRAGDRQRRRRPLRSCAGRRISGHQPAAGLHPHRPQAARRRPHRRRRRCPIDLFVSRRQRAQHPGFPGAFQPVRRDHHARAQLPLDASRSWPPPTP